MNQNRNNMPFFKSIFNKKILSSIKNKLNCDKRTYIVTIKAILDLFNDPINSPMIIDEITDIVHSLIISYKQPCFYSKSTINLILTYFLPYTFFIQVNEEEAIKIKNNLKNYSEAIIDVFIKKEKNPNFSIFTWTSNFYKLNIDFYSNYNQENSLNYFNFFSKFINNNYLDKKISIQDTLEIYGAKPIVLLSDLKIEEALFTTYFFQKKFPNLPFDLLITDTRSLQRQNGKVKPKWVI